MEENSHHSSLVEESAALRRFLVWCLRFISAAVVLLLIATFLIEPTQWRRYISIALVASVALISWWQMRRNLRAAMVTIVIGVWLMSSVGILMFSGVHSANVIVYPFTIAIVGWTLGRRWLILVSAMTICFILVIGGAEMLGLFTPSVRASPAIVTVQIVMVLAMLALLSYEGRQILAGSRDRAVALGQELKLRATQAASSEHELAEILDNVPAAVASFEVDARVRNCNTRYADLFGMTVAQVKGCVTLGFVPESQLSVLMPRWNMAMAGSPQSYRRMNVDHRTGEEIWLDCNLIPEFVDGKVAGLFAMLVDVTGKVRAENALRELNNELEARVAKRTAELARAMEDLHASRDELVRSQAKAGLSALVASVSHELSTPIGNSVLVATSLADMAKQMQLQLDSDQLRKSSLLQHNRALAEGSEMLIHNLERAEALLGNFKQVSADQASEQRRSFDLAAVVAEVVNSLAPSQKNLSHRIEVDIPAGIVMDSLPGPIGQVLINLINNAYTHAFEGRCDGVLRISASVHGSNVQLRVADNGAGMTRDVVLHMFEPFFSTKIGEGGTGLGMSIVDSIVRKTLGGGISVRSVVGQGTSYEIVLPLKTPLLFAEA